MTPDNSAVALLLRFEREGYELKAAGDRLLVKPAERLSGPDREALRAIKPELLTLLRIVDDGVRQRRLVFVSLLDAGEDCILPDLVFRPGLTPVAGRCVSCGDGLDRPTFGKCWRCCLAWRLAVRLPISAEWAAAVDEARRVA